MSRLGTHCRIQPLTRVMSETWQAMPMGPAHTHKKHARNLAEGHSLSARCINRSGIHGSWRCRHLRWPENCVKAEFPEFGFCLENGETSVFCRAYVAGVIHILDLYLRRCWRHDILRVRGCYHVLLKLISTLYYYVVPFLQHDDSMTTLLFSHCATISPPLEVRENIGSSCSSSLHKVIL